MAWFTPTNRKDHPCRTPSEEEASTEHRFGEMWRCEVCNSLWRWEKPGRWKLKDDDWFIRRRNRKQGYGLPREDW